MDINLLVAATMALCGGPSYPPLHHDYSRNKSPQEVRKRNKTNKKNKQASMSRKRNKRK